MILHSKFQFAFCILQLPRHYICRNASKGFNFAALLAGYNPDTIERMSEIANPAANIQGVMAVMLPDCNPAPRSLPSAFIRNGLPTMSISMEKPIPSRSPKIPPIIPIIRHSARNIFIMS